MRFAPGAELPSPTPYLRPSRQRRRGLIVLLGIVLIVTVGIVAGAFYVKARAQQLEAEVSSDFASAQTSLEQAKVLLSAANAEHNLAKVTAADQYFANALTYFRRARQRVDGSSLLGIASRVPLVNGYTGSRQRSVDHLAAMGVAVTHAGQEAADIDKLLINPTAVGTGPAQLLAIFKNAGPNVAAARADLQTALEEVKQVDAGILPAGQRSTLTSTKGQIETALLGTQEFDRLRPALVEILGGNGARTYLFEQVNPAELRSGGGFIGSVSVITADQGNLRLVSSEDVTTYTGSRARVGQPGYVAPPNTLTGFYAGKSWYFADSNFAPDFQTNAKWARFFAEQTRQVHANGVFSIDYYAVASLLRLTGPIAVPQYGLTVDSNNFVPELIKRDLRGDPARKLILAAVAGHLIDRIARLPSNEWSNLIQVMNAAAAEKHLQVSFDSQSAEAEMARFGWTGGLNPQSTKNFLLETEDNMGGTKSNYFVTRRYNLTLTPKAGIVHHALSVDIENGAPVYTLYGGHYYTYVRFYVPDSASHVTLKSGSTEYRSTIPADKVNNTTPPGYKLADGWIFMETQFGSRHFKLNLEYDMLAAGGQASESLYWQKQPGTQSDAVTITWQGPKQSTLKTQLDQDIVISAGPAGLKASPAQTTGFQLPSLSF